MSMSRPNVSRSKNTPRDRPSDEYKPRSNAVSNRAISTPSIAQQTLGDVAPQCLRRLDRLTAAVADQRARPGREFVAFGMAAKIVVIVENENAGPRPDRAAIKPAAASPLMPAPTTTKS